MSINDIHEICDGVFIGSINSSKNSTLLQEKKIKYILNCTPAKDCDNRLESTNLFEYWRIPVDDQVVEEKDEEQFTRYMDEAADYIQLSIEKKKNILVHCHSGASRSPLFVACYLVKHLKMSVDAALILLKEKRQFVSINFDFLKRLGEFGKKYEEEKKSDDSSSSIKGEEITVSRKDNRKFYQVNWSASGCITGNEHPETSGGKSMYYIYR